MTEKVFPAITAVMADLSSEGISKDSKNQQQGYSFRGIDAVYNALSGLLVKHKLLMLPRVLSRDVAERINQKGTALFYVAVEVEFDLVSSEDGSKHTIKTYGEAMDSGDKATNKAMSAAYKYAAMMAFCIPTEGDNDADATTHEVQGRKNPSVSVHPEGSDWWGCEGYGLSAAEAKKQGLGEKVDQWTGEIRALTTAQEWRGWCAAHTEEIKPLPLGWRVQLREEAAIMARELGVDMNAKG